MIFRFVAISSEEESFVREFELNKDNTLLDFHKTLQEELEYDSSHMALFFLTTDKWEKEEEFTLFDMGSDTTVMDEVIIDDLIMDEKQKMLYVFDIFNERALFIECVGKTEEVKDRKYPVCTRSQGMPPQQIMPDGFTPIDPLTDNDLSSDLESDLPDFENIDDYIDD